jgi:dTDP-glucose pyrophosphorylase
MKPTLVVLAAGLGSRFGGLKQLEAVGPQGEAIIDYSVYDAVRAGFGKVVFVIKKEMETPFREKLMRRFETRIETECAFQELDMLLEGYTLPPERKKPWGTAHAILVAKKSVQSPFAVINADDYYGREAFQGMQEFLTGARGENEYGLMGYRLGNTLSEHGSVSRGICEIDERHYLRFIEEVTKISRRGTRIVRHDKMKPDVLSEDTIVSMNMWGFSTAVFDQIEAGFSEFLDEKIDDPNAEYYIPAMVDRLIRDGRAEVRVLRSDAAWFGITYQEDLQTARTTVLKKIENGEYPRNLWS